MRARLVAEKLSMLITRQIGLRWGERIPFYYVFEHPKSGGTWLGRMVSDYLQVPFPQQAFLPLGFSCVMKSHLQYDPRLRGVFYMYRDGRDVMVSLYYHRIWVARYANRPASRYIAGTYEKLFGDDYDPDNIVRHLPRFIEYEFTKPGRGTPLNWSDHIRNWCMPEPKEGVAYVGYEDLLRDCEKTLRTALEQITDEPIDPWRLSVAIEKMSMQRQTGRKPGEEDLTQHTRKGVAGDWKNYFSRESAELFDDLAGDILVHLGYEEDRNWIDRYDYPTP